MIIPQAVRNDSADPPQPADALAEIRFRLPSSWRDELQEIARRRQLAVADIMRQLIRDLIRQSYTEPPAGR